MNLLRGRFLVLRKCSSKWREAQRRKRLSWLSLSVFHWYFRSLKYTYLPTTLAILNSEKTFRVSWKKVSANYICTSYIFYDDNSVTASFYSQRLAIALFQTKCSQALERQFILVNFGFRASDLHLINRPMSTNSPPVLSPKQKFREPAFECGKNFIWWVKMNKPEQCLTKRLMKFARWIGKSQPLLS